MKQRMTKATLEKIADNCTLAVNPKGGWHYAIEYAYGRPRLGLTDAKGCWRDVSPRLPSGQLAEWMWAYLKGVEDGRSNA